MQIGKSLYMTKLLEQKDDSYDLLKRDLQEKSKIGTRLNISRVCGMRWMVVVEYWIN